MGYKKFKEGSSVVVTKQIPLVDTTIEVGTVASVLSQSGDKTTARISIKNFNGHDVTYDEYDVTPDEIAKLPKLAKGTKVKLRKWATHEGISHDDVCIVLKNAPYALQRVSVSVEGKEVTAWIDRCKLKKIKEHTSKPQPETQPANDLLSTKLTDGLRFTYDGIEYLVIEPDFNSDEFGKFGLLDMWGGRPTLVQDTENNMNFPYVTTVQDILEYFKLKLK